MNRIILLVLFLLNITTTYAQQPNKPSASEIHESLKKLNFLGTVLYVAAHPDDENTRLISYFSNEVKARTAYLSITRGDGGQNLIGPELQELLGIIRTQELLAARRIDGGEQFFTRAIDFGYSKHPDETLKLWNKDEVLKDVVAIIRKFRPDVIINRFKHDTPGTTHGQHTSSAVLSVAAFDLVGDPTFKSHNLSKPWQPKRLYFNTHWFFYGSREKFAEADKSKMLSFDTGVYYSSSGLSNNEIASLSRSQHQSQGFGSTGSRGSEIEYIDLIKGELPSNKEDVFDGIDTTWGRVKGGKAIGEILHKVEQNFNFKNPSASLPDLLKAYVLIDKLEDTHWRAIKRDQIKDVISACAGLYLEAKADQSQSTTGAMIKLNIEAINRSAENITLNSVTTLSSNIKHAKDLSLKNNESNKFDIDFAIPADETYTSPYWLNKNWDLGMYVVDHKKFIGDPETSRNSKIGFNLTINEIAISFEKDIIYKYNDPVKGEIYQPFEVLPQVTAGITNKVNIFADNTAKDIPVIIKSSIDSLRGSISLNHPEGWKVSPEKIDFKIDQKGGERTVNFTVSPPDYQSEGKISPVIQSGNKSYGKKLVEIKYDHIPKQSILLSSAVKVVRLDIQKKGNLIGYIQGAGDNVPTSLRQIGYSVTELNEKDITAENLQNFDAVILGIRAYNVNDRAKYYQKELHSYAEKGGTLIAQYNTSFRTKVTQIAPYHLKLSRDRVAEENAAVTIINPKHEMMSYPNKITDADFEGWIQERGLYFPSEWGKEFTPMLSMHDKGESPKDGSLLIANHGKGHFIYTGLSFFRELPAGVPGAYKLFANMLSVGKNNLKKQLKN